MKNTTIVNDVFVLIVNTFILLIIIQTVNPIFKDYRLHGVEKKNFVPQFTFENFLNNKFQNEINDYLSKITGFRGLLVRIDNQINYSIFSEMSSKYSSKVVLGKNGFLYQKEYIDSYNKRDTVSIEVLKESLEELEKLTSIFHKKGKQVVFLITPSKATIYPEYLPNDLIDRNNKKQSNYYNLISIIDGYKINYFDAHAYFVNLKNKLKYPVFSKSGTHWNGYAVAYFTRDFINYLEKISGKNLKNIEIIDTVKNEIPPVSADRDIAQLCNLLFPNPLFDDNYTSETICKNYNDIYAPNMLFVGGSFLWTLFYYMDKHEIYRERDMYYYFKKNYTFPDSTIEEIDKTKISLQDLLKNDFIIIENNEASLKKIGVGFIETALSIMSF